MMSLYKIKQDKAAVSDQVHVYVSGQHAVGKPGEIYPARQHLVRDWLFSSVKSS